MLLRAWSAKPTLLQKYCSYAERYRLPTTQWCGESFSSTISTT
jgi:hypothetical protein